VLISSAFDGSGRSGGLGETGLTGEAPTQIALDALW
jgi:hypothetical protein